MKTFTPEEIESAVRNVTAIMSFEDIELTEQNKEDIRRVLRDEITEDEMIAEIEKRNGLKAKKKVGLYFM